MVSPALAPRSPRCVVCRSVGAIEDVAFRLWDENGERIGTKQAAAYCRSVGMAGTPQKVYNRLVGHRKHVEDWLARQERRGGIAVPAEGEGNVVRILPPSGPVAWLDVNKSGMEIGMDALRDLKARLDSGELDSNAVIALARLGIGAAHKRGDLETKGRGRSGLDDLLKLAAGVPRE